MPPQYSSISSRAVMPAGASLTPGLAHAAGDARRCASPVRPLRPWPVHQSAPALQDVAHPVERLDIVDQRRAAEQADLERIGRLVPRVARACPRCFRAATIPRRRYRRRRRGADAGRGRRAAASRSRARGSRARRDIRRAGRCRPPSPRPHARRSACLRGSGAGRVSRKSRSLNVPGSPSSALTAMRRGPGSPRTARHLRPVGKPAPPSPRRPAASRRAKISSTASSPERTRSSVA